MYCSRVTSRSISRTCMDEGKHNTYLNENRAFIKCHKNTKHEFRGKYFPKTYLGGKTPYLGDENRAFIKCHNI